MSAPTPKNIYKEAEFNVFLQLLKEGTNAHWAEVANALGVDADTITRWRHRPEAIKAQVDGIVHALKQMETVGAKDWRMWESKLKMLGVSPVNILKVDDANTVQKLLDKYGLGESNAGQTPQAKG